MDGGLSAIKRSFSRCVSRKRDPLSTEGARLFGGRFNPVGTSALYLAGSPTLAVAEALQLAEMFSVVSFNPRLLISIDVELSEVLDLTSAKNVGLLGLTETDLLAEWRDSSTASATQHIGAQAQDSGVEAILFPSRIELGVSNLCVFRENLRATSRLIVEGYDDIFPLAE
jgi:RES domain-containing protein